MAAGPVAAGAMAAGPVAAGGPGAGGPASGGAGVVTLAVGNTSRTVPRGRRPPGDSGGLTTTGPEILCWTCRWSPDGPVGITQGADEAADLALSMSSADALLVKAGELHPCVAFMQGRLKTSGDNALLLQVLEWTSKNDIGNVLALWQGPH